MLKKQVLHECASALLITLFLYASLSKFLDFATFQKEMMNQPFPTSWAPFVVWIIPCTEIAIAVLLIFDRTRLLGLYGSFILMGLFTVYSIAILLHFFRYVPCSCGGVIKHLTWRQHLVFNLFFLALAVGGILIQRRNLLFPYVHFKTTKNSLT
jgi:putative oxidoreductase